MNRQHLEIQGGMHKWGTVLFAATALAIAAHVMADVATPDSAQQEMSSIITAGHELQTEGPLLDAMHQALAQQKQQLQARSDEIDQHKTAVHKEASDYHAEQSNIQNSCLNPASPAPHAGTGSTANTSNQPPTATSEPQQTCAANMLETLTIHQKALDDEMTAYNLAADEWNNRELSNVAALNAFYKKQQDYIHNANGFMASSGFQGWILATRSHRTCTATAHVGKAQQQLAAAVTEVLACLQQVRGRMKD